MSRQISPFAALTGAEKQIKWLEYQSIRLPYVETKIDHREEEASEVRLSPQADEPTSRESVTTPPQMERPQPPPEVPRMMPESSRIRHSHYDAVIARLKQAELQSRRSQSLS